MPRGRKSKLRAQKKRHQNRAEKQGDKSAQAAAGEEGEAICSSSSVLGDAGAGPLQAPPRAPATPSATAGASCERSAVKAKGQVQKSKKSPQASTATESSGQDLLSQKANLLVRYRLYQHKKNQPVKKGDMLKVIHKWFRKDFPEILRRASERMDRLFGLQVKEVKPNGNCYTLVDSEDESLSSGFRFPNKGILMPVLGVISLNGNSATEEMIWEFLNKMSVYDGKSHLVFGEPRKLITQDLVQEKYLVYQPVPNSDPPRYEFLWGPRAHAETSEMQVLESFSLLNSNIHTVLAPHLEKALKEEDERAQARAQASPRAAPPPKASGHSRAKSSL
ncbi:PREDICTED: melanoma-associated antigen B2 [Myotis davidii]|uniref:Melanoma-associated antigen B4 n=1 Tax=Myotis davidii TaxID=225400 RepID=L5MBG0_MYODS|nr:PREDICTED: melanoma-associated antigen B2 [Myotis davidii]ELK35721.1 Melanoma-associated antigen B4 [Myotis davidii]